MLYSPSLYLLAATLSLAGAREIPANVQSFFDSHLNGACPNPLSIAYNSGQGKSDTVYCKDDTSGAIYLKDTSNGYADMDIDCDGLNAGEGDCFNDPTGQSMTAFQSDAQKFGIDDLDAHIHTYVVLGNDNSASEGNGGEKFDPKSAGIEPLSVVAVVCGGKMFYGVWGDINGGVSTGESSLALGQLCFPNDGLTGNNGHSEHDILYIAFPGEEAVPGASANWKAKDSATFEQSLATLGDSLVAKLGSAKGNGNKCRSRATKSRVMRRKLQIPSRK
ncbi:fungal chitosanase of glycosyl hydrolase group 75-domain-containing protein [Clohesyomyces aquaticus]|uniref:Endo-chitosanase n=1 Tax=Clohesyomyces aquaticus TaxID=1231657 RepID=A0A1Y1ZX63_9PLEO|nr:fungal chitosanase of glycosyl hydrolase group 75-domain-containing protein [Clohesyomyces aquaticus]